MTSTPPPAGDAAGTYQPDWTVVDPVTYRALRNAGYPPSFLRELVEVGVDLSVAWRVLGPAAHRGVSLTSVHIEVLSTLGAVDGAALLLRAGAVEVADLLWLATHPAEELRAARDLLAAGVSPAHLHELHARLQGFHAAAYLASLGTPVETILACTTAQEAQMLLDAVCDLYDSADVVRAAHARERLSRLGVHACLDPQGRIVLAAQAVATEVAPRRVHVDPPARRAHGAPSRRR